MIPRGADALLKMRIAGQRPAAEVWVCVGDMREPDWWKWSNTADMPEILVRPEDPIDCLDLRCLMGLRVLLLTREWDGRAARVHERLEAYAAEIAVMSPGFNPDIGWRWVKDIGRIDFDQRDMRPVLRNIHADATHAAVTGNKPAYEAAQAAERKILEGSPWLR